MAKNNEKHANEYCCSLQIDGNAMKTFLALESCTLETSLLSSFLIAFAATPVVAVLKS